MHASTSFRVLGLLAALAAGSREVRAQLVANALYNFETVTKGYNLVALSSTATTTLNSYGDTQGGLAINGNLTISGGSIDNQNVATGGPSLYVNGKFTLTGNTMLNAGSASISNSVNGSSYTWNQTQNELIANSTGDYLNITNSGSTTNPLTVSGPSGWNWSTVTSDLKSDASTLANATINGTTVIAGTIAADSGQNLDFTPNSTPAANSTVIFTLNASLLSGNSYNGTSFSNISINVPSDVNYVINVINTTSGMTLFSGASFNSGSNDTNLLWNIEGSGTINLGGGSFYGSVLAPSATITNNSNTTINGQVVASSFTDNNNELHDETFDAVAGAVAVPEPMTFALWGVALCGGAVLVRRKLSASSPRLARVTR